MPALLGSLLAALLLGMRHALEPDHLAALSTLVAERPRLGALLGALWGIGHAAALFACGALLLAARAALSPRISDGLELGVAAVLIALGARSLGRAVALGRSGAAAAHRHGPTEHVHKSTEAHLHIGRLALARRPLLVGMAHGLAGSGALTAAALGALPSTGAALAFMAIFGLGAAAAMALLAGAAGLPLSRLARSRGARALLSAAAGVTSLAVGVAWGLPLVERLLAR